MSKKRKSNKQVKAMILDVALQGRKTFWHGESSDIFAAKSAEHIRDYFGENSDDCETEQMKGSVKFWWSDCVNEIEDKVKGKRIDKYHELLPLVCNLYGNRDTVCQVSTSYN